MRILTVTVSIIVLLSGSLFGLEVDEEELIEQVDEEITFVNYEGPHEEIDSRDEIIGIGVYLGSTDERRFFTRNYVNKYTVIHAVDPEADELLDADIFIIGESALADHIQSIRWMLQGFLSTYYSYNEEDAALLAEFITYYNAVFRKNIDYIGDAYKQIVVENLDPEKVGLSRSYKQWPGQSMLVIPLTEKAEEGAFGALDSDMLSEDEVIEDLRGREDRGVESRQDMVELKEREIEEEKKSIEEEKRQIEEEEQILEERREELEERKKTLEEQPEEEETEALAAEEAEEAPAEEQPETEEQVEEQVEAQAQEEEQVEEQQDQPEEQDLEVVRAEIEREEQEIAEEEEQLEERREEAAEREEEQEEREERVREEREQIAADQRELIAEEEGREAEEEEEAVAETETEVTVPFIIFRESAEGLTGKFVLAGAQSGKIKTDSRVDTVTSRAIEEIAEEYLVIAERDNEIRLFLFDKESLRINRFSEDIVFRNGYLLVENGAIYTPLLDNGSWYLGKFDGQLRTIEQSELEVAPFTLLFYVNDVIYAQSRDGTIVGFDSGDLEEIE